MRTRFLWPLVALMSLAVLAVECGSPSHRRSMSTTTSTTSTSTPG